MSIELYGSHHFTFECIDRNEMQFAINLLLFVENDRTASIALVVIVAGSVKMKNKKRKLKSIRMIGRKQKFEFD